jgi:hypothetical protein
LEGCDLEHCGWRILVGGVIWSIVIQSIVTWSIVIWSIVISSIVNWRVVIRSIVVGGL